jgi:hypothetical protein
MSNENIERKTYVKQFKGGRISWIGVSTWFLFGNESAQLTADTSKI